FTVAISRDRSN
ncbi:acetyltransferase domain protein, partial [Vibrio parahaemolyticus V-223/04]